MESPVAPYVFVLEETRLLILDRAVIKGVFHTYAALLCVSHGFYASVSSLIVSHFKRDTMYESNALMLHSQCPALDLSSWDCITDDTVRQIATRITDLTLNSNAHIHGSTIKRLTNLTRLSLSVRNKCIEGRHLTGLTGLTNLKLHGRHELLSSEVAEMTRLRKLDLYADEEIESYALYTLTGLESLDLSGKNLIESDGLKNLGCHLTYLSLLSNTLIDDSGLTGLTSLLSLYLGGKPGLVTGHSISQLTQLTGLRLQGVDHVTDDALTTLTNLRELDLSYNSRITDLGLRPLTGLTSLYLCANTTITDAGISTLTRLETLYLSVKSPVTRPLTSRLSLLTNLVNSVERGSFLK